MESQQSATVAGLSLTLAPKSEAAIEARMTAHGRGTAAKVTTASPPTGEILHIREHATQREALLCAALAEWLPVETYSSAAQESRICIRTQHSVSRTR